MDSITQAALGGAVGEWVLGRKLGWRGMAWGLFFGTLPDLDVLVSPFLDEVTRLKWHRGISHSILMLFAGAFLLMKPLSWLHRGRGLSPGRAWWFIFLAWSTHVLIDVFTTYGTQIWEPFSDARASFNNMSIIDPLFSLPLLVCVFLALARVLIFVFRTIRYRRTPEEERGEQVVEPRFSGKVAKIALMTSCLYSLFSFGMKTRAMKVIEARMQEEIPNAELVQVAPTLGNTILWRGLVETQTGYWVTYWSLFDQESAKWDYYPKHAELTERFRDEKHYRGLEWFSQGRWVARICPDGKILLIDMRFGESRSAQIGRQFPIFKWAMRYDEDGNFEATHPPSKIDAGEALSLLWNRLTGNLELWQSAKPF